VEKKADVRLDRKIIIYQKDLSAFNDALEKFLEKWDI
jgi:hypothetical protein